MQLTIKPQHQIEQCHQIGEMGSHIASGTVEQVLEVTDSRQHREDRFDQHPFVPSPLGTEFEILRDSGGRLEAGIGQSDGLSLEGLHQRQENLIVDVGRAPVPGNHFTTTVDQPTELDPHNPTVVGFALLTQLPGAASLAPGMEQLDAVAVDDREETGIGQEEIAPVLMGCQQALQASAMGQSEPLRVVPFEPTVEGTELDALEGEEQADGDQFAGIEASLRMLGQVTDPVVYQVEKHYDKSKVVMGFVPPVLLLTQTVVKTLVD